MPKADIPSSAALFRYKNFDSKSLEADNLEWVDLGKEVWCDMYRYEDELQVSHFGRVRKKDDNKLLHVF